eukprot:5980620-Pyramimonas_sp.AAC.1
MDVDAGGAAGRNAAPAGAGSRRAEAEVGSRMADDGDQTVGLAQAGGQFAGAGAQSRTLGAGGRDAELVGAG